MSVTSEMARIAPITPDPCHLAQSFCSLGASDEQLARLFSVSEETVGGWMARDADFSAAVRRGRNFADADVARSLHRRAVGSSYTVERVFVGRRGPMRVPYTKHLPPNPKAALDWLVNRRPQDWGPAAIKRKLREWEDARDAAARRPLFFSTRKLAALVDECKEADVTIDEAPAERPVALDARHSSGTAGLQARSRFMNAGLDARGPKHMNAPLEWRGPSSPIPSAVAMG